MLVYSCSRYLVLAIAALLKAGPVLAAPASGYSATQSGNILQLTTPISSKVFLGDVGFDQLDSYRIEIPLSDLAPPRTAPDSAASSGQSNASDSGRNGGQPVAAPESIGDVKSLLVEANRLYNKGKFDDSLRYVDEAVRREPENARAWIMRGSLFHVLGHKDMAKQAWEKASGIDPDNQQIKNVLRSYQ